MKIKIKNKKIRILIEGIFVLKKIIFHIFDMDVIKKISFKINLS